MSTQQKEEKTYGKRLEELIKQRGKSKTGVSAHLGMSQNTITHWIQDKGQPDLSQLVKIAESLGMRPINLIAYLLGEDTPNLTFFKLLDIFSRITIELFGIALKPDPVKKQILECVQYYPVRQSQIYPRIDNADVLMPLFFDEPYSVKNTYYIVKGNIYYKYDFIEDYDSASKYYAVDTSIYDYVNEGNSIKKIKEAYEKERNFKGNIGALSADYFYLLNYITGHFSKETD